MHHTPKSIWISSEVVNIASWMYAQKRYTSVQEMLEILMATSLDCGMELMECQSD
jgi:hypothetical protein